MPISNFLQSLGVRFPIIQAPMAGGLTTPQLVAAVCNAGGLGSLGAAYLMSDQILAEAREIRRLTDKPFAINLFAGGYGAQSIYDAAPMLALIGEIHQALGLPAPVLPAVPPDPFPDQLDAVLRVRPAVFSFTFGIPSPDVMNLLYERGIPTVGTATTVGEARMLEESGAAAIVAQGAEAGGHRGTFLADFESSMVPTVALVEAVRSAVSIPVIASGGLMDGRDIAQSLASGAAAVQLGTAFLLCPECGTSEPHRHALLSACTDTTTITRAFSGRPARGLRNTFVDLLDGMEHQILPYPLQNSLTRTMRTAAAKQGQAAYLSLWAGQGVARARVLPAADLVKLLVEEAKEAGCVI